MLRGLHLENGTQSISNIYRYCFSFISIAAALPVTAYIKMVDIWMILMMLYPILTVSLLTARELLKNLNSTSGKSHKSSGSSRVLSLQNSGDSQYLQIMSFMMDKGLPMFIIGFAIIYWTCGIINVSFSFPKGGC